MTPDTLKILQATDTPTVCNAIEVAQGARGFANFTRKTLYASDPKAPALVGYACTAQIAAAQPPTQAPELIKKQRMAYYRAMATGGKNVPSLCVIEDLDGDQAVGAFWGEINTAVHRGFGLVGTLTNGLMRDLDHMADAYPVLAGGIGPSHAFVHVRSVGQRVSIFGMTVAQGDLVHADRHGALVIPAELIPQLTAAIDQLRKTEELILGPARQPDFDFETFTRAWAAFEAART